MSKFDKAESNLNDLDELRKLFVCNFATILPINRLIIICGGESGHIKDLCRDKYVADCLGQNLEIQHRPGARTTSKDDLRSLMIYCVRHWVIL
jgi:hypothetical protein